MEKEKDFITIIDENGKETKCEILLTFDSEEFNKSYVLYTMVGDDSGEVFAASYDESDSNEGKLHPIENDKEWDLVEEILNSFVEDEESNEE